MIVLVLGASGQLATHLRELLPDATYWGRDKLDLGQPAIVRELVEAHRPTVIVNAAAYTAVDKAENERDAAWAVNADAPAMLARAAAALDVPMVHISTDYVFDGLKEGEYEVADPCRPLSVYGASKLGGELAVRSLCPKHWILRTSWVFSEFGTNFVKTMLRLARERNELRVVADQFGRPTYAGDLARLVARLAGDAEDAETRLPFGTYHAVGGAPTSWHGFAQAIVAAGVRHKLLTRAPRVTAIGTADYQTPARRPRNSVLKASDEWAAGFGVEFDWARGLDMAVQRLAELAK
jgi:dTDP-4-dehydrorhamnose reductase